MSEVRCAAESRYPANEFRGSGQEEQPHALKPESGAAGGKSYPTPPRLRPEVTAGRSNRMPEVRGSSREELPHV